MRWVTPALVLCTAACVPPQPSLDASVCPDDAGVTLEWSSDAETVLLLDGDRPSVEAQAGQKWLAADRTRIVRLAAMRGQATTWSVSKIEACVAPRDGGSGTLLRGDGSPAAEQEVTINGKPLITDATGRFAVPDGTAPYTVSYRFTWGPNADRHTTVFMEGATVASPVVRTIIGDTGHIASLVVRVSSAVGTVARGHMTTVVTRVGKSGDIQDLGALSGELSFPLVIWHGAPTTTLTVTAVRQFMKSIVTDDTYMLPDIQGASAPLEVELSDGETKVVEVTVDAIEPDLRDLYLPSESANEAALIGYGAPWDAPRIYSGRARAHAKLPVVGRAGYWDEWVVSEPIPREGDTEGLPSGSGDFVVPREGAVIAPLYRAARFVTTDLSISEPVLRWELPQPALCRLLVKEQSDSEQRVVYAVGSADLRKVGINFSGTFRATLDCYPELAGIDDLLTGQRGLDFARQVGRRARVQTLGTFVVR